jgi:dTDP-D-glucose 4,6-dehydratase
MILNMLEGRSLPVYGEGKNVRDWVESGRTGESRKWILGSDVAK